MRFVLVALLAGLGCSGETSVGGILTPPDLPPSEPVVLPSPDPQGGSPLRDTDGDGLTDDTDGDIDGDGLPNDTDPDPDGDGQPGYSLPPDPADDPVIDPGTGLPVLEVGGARGRVCAPNGTTWVSGAQVTILTPTGAFQTTSNGDGWWQIDGIGPGTYGVVVNKGSFELSYNIEILEGEVTSEVFDECLSQADLRIAAVVGRWDHVEDVLTGLGLQITTYEGNTWPSQQQPIAADVLATRHAEVTDLLTNPTRLAQYDVLFLNCGISEAWASSDQALVAQTLSDFVEAGGSIYASDWSYFAIEAAFPGMISFLNDDTIVGAARFGRKANVSGIIVDPTMATLLGSNQANIAYDLNEWVVMESVDPSVEVLVEGAFRQGANDGSAVATTGPLSVRFFPGQGRVIYTTFHNEGVATTPDMHAMLEDIVLSL